LLRAIELDKVLEALNVVLLFAYRSLVGYSYLKQLGYILEV
jgi:hypothetical protein